MNSRSKIVSTIVDHTISKQRKMPKMKWFLWNGGNFKIHKALYCTVIRIKWIFCIELDREKCLQYAVAYRQKKTECVPVNHWKLNNGFLFSGNYFPVDFEQRNKIVCQCTSTYSAETLCPELSLACGTTSLIVPSACVLY